jgi:hypothetical protein
VLLLLLEDDAMTVRLTGINTMSFFAKQSSSIRPAVMRFLIDMLNDEIDEVRIGALKGIAVFNQIMKLTDAEVDTVLFNLSEDNTKLRAQIYKFFGEIIIEDRKVLLQLIERVVKNLNVFVAQDQHLIFKLMQKIGYNHSGDIIKIYHKILNVDKKYLTQEPNWNDTTYVAKMIAI